ncbi:hypothetical protein Tcan_07084 [Toxocara canis]|uniref:Apple domain-containing protein n=1 Tax=Toxocara canis TaxID=6265 RepID=A0A0B2UVS9_TOXCA|nr:hypothetical protein Tcan_07084 [Toxocara canis]
MIPNHILRCKGVMYGFVGGHQVIACELYDSPQTIQLIYAPYSNMFVLRGSSCEHAYRSKVNIRLRDCFVVYSDRDQPEQIVPYAVVKDAFNSTENDCLSTCLHDTRCKGVMYGFVGGHQVIACELYDSPQTIQLIYAPYSNMFVLRGSSCEHAYEKILPLVVEKNEERCKGVMYGFVGGHQVIACELYDSPQTIQLIYAPYSNMFVLRGSSCEHAYEKILPLVVEKNEEVGAVSTRRKTRYRKAFEKKHRLRQQNFA